MSKKIKNANENIKKTQLALKITELLSTQLGDNLDDHLHVLDIVASLTVQGATVKIQSRES